MAAATTFPTEEVSPTSRPADANAGDVSPTSKPVADAALPPVSQGEAPAVKSLGAPLVLPPSAADFDSFRDARKPSIQIKPHAVMSGEPKKRPSEQVRRRLSSPPPPPYVLRTLR